MKKLCLLLVGMLAGCASTGVVQMEKDTYLIAKRSPQLGFGPPIAAKGEVHAEANAFCSKDGKAVETIKADETSSGFAKSAAFSLEFRCVSRAP